MRNSYQWVLHSQFLLVRILLHSNSTGTNFIPIALKFVLVEIVLVETVLVEDPLYCNYCGTMGLKDISVLLNYRICQSKPKKSCNDWGDCQYGERCQSSEGRPSLSSYHRGLSTLKKYQCDSMGLHKFFHHSAIVSCITFHL